MASSFKTRDAASYDDVAAQFDRLSETYSAPFADKLIDLAELRSGSLVLDLAAGSGVVSRRVIGAGSRCVAADLSAGMLRAARKSAAHLDCVRMDAERAAFKPGSFDVAACLFGMLHFPDTLGALRACAELLKPGGVLVFAFGTPTPWARVPGQLPRLAIDCAHRATGRLLKAPQALAGRLEREFPGGGAGTETGLAARPSRIRSSFLRSTKTIGFTRIRTGWMRKRFRVDSAEAFWELQTVFSSRARKQLAELPPSSKQRVRDAFLAEAQRVQERGGELVYDVAASWVRCVAPVPPSSRD